MAAALLAGAVSALVASTVAAILCRRSAGRMAADFERRCARQREADAVAHRVASESAAAATDQLTRAGYGYIDHLRAEIDNLSKQLAESRIAHDGQVREMQGRIVALNAEVIDLRGRLTGAGGSLAR